MAPLIAIALQLAQFAPTLSKIFGASEPTVAAAKKVVDAAISVTGAVTGDDALSAIQASSEKAYEFELASKAIELDLLKLQYADLADARARDAEFIKDGRTNKRASVMLAAVFVMLLLGLAAVVFMSNLDEFAKTTLNLLIGRLLGHVDQAFNFEFGTTRSSKDKDETINKLSGEK